MGTGVVLACALVHMLQPSSQSLTSPCVPWEFNTDSNAYGEQSPDPLVACCDAPVISTADVAVTAVFHWRLPLQYVRACMSVADLRPRISHP